MSVSIKDVRKGTMVSLRNGWQARVEDNMVNAHTRLCTVFGHFTEMGSVYSTDIVEANVNGAWETVVHTPAQAKGAKNRMAFGF